MVQDGSSNLVSQTKLFLYTVDTTDPLSNISTLVSQELSSSDGSFELYATTKLTYKLLMFRRTDNLRLHGLHPRRWY